MRASTEIHFHVLPGVDDGPRTLEEAVWLARTAAADGTQTIVATPHVNSYFQLDGDTLPGRLRELRERLRREHIHVAVLGGGELAPEMVPRLSAAQLEAIAQGPAGRRWLLLEAPLAGMDDSFSAAADEVRQRGFGVVVAHPERSLASLSAGWKALEREIRAGSAMQINAWSVAGLHGERTRIEALRVLETTPRVAVASDAHGPHRAPSLRLAVDALTRLGHRNPARLVSAIPGALVAKGLPVEPVALAA